MKKRFRDLVRRLGSLVRFFLLSILLIGVVFHLGVRDRVVFTAPLFYGLPARILWVVAMVYAVTSVRRRLHLCLAVLMMIGFGYRSFFASSGFTELKPNQPTLVFWNVDWGQVEQSDFFEFVNETEAEVYVFAEFHERLQEAAQKGLIETQAKGYTVRLAGRGIAFVYRDHLSFEPQLARETKEYRFFRVQIGSRTIGVADVSSDPRLDRGPTMEALLQFSEGCDLVCGDFNTPYDSIHFDQFRKNFSSGVTEKFGGRETWPVPWPVLSLDHIFVHPRNTIVTYGILEKRSTDHYHVAIKISD